MTKQERTSKIIASRRKIARLLAATFFAAGLQTTSAAMAQDYYGNPCPPAPCITGEVVGSETQPSVAADGSSSALDTSSNPGLPSPESIPSSTPAQRDFANTNFTRSLAAADGGISAPDMPGMIGDFFGGNLLQNDPFLAPFPNDEDSLAIAGGDRRFKIAENVSPIPQDRVFLNYHHFHNVFNDVNRNAQSLDRFTLGMEKTFWSKDASIEVRLPISSALDSNQIDGSTSTTGGEVGNLGLALKFNLASSCNWMLSGGLAMTVPTGDDYRRLDGAGVLQYSVENEAFHWAPFLGYASRSGDWFFQNYLQVDLDGNGNTVRNGANTITGVIQEQNLLYLDMSLGRWLTRTCRNGQIQSGVAAISELHYTTTITDSDIVVADGNNAIRNPYGSVNVLNFSGALHFQRGLTSLRIGGGAPLRDDEERQFDAEIFAQLNRNF